MKRYESADLASRHTGRAEHVIRTTYSEPLLWILHQQYLPPIEEKVARSVVSSVPPLVLPFGAMGCPPLVQDLYIFWSYPVSTRRLTT
jgi:hypothetical protein